MAAARLLIIANMGATLRIIFARVRGVSGVSSTDPCVWELTGRWDLLGDPVYWAGVPTYTFCTGRGPRPPELHGARAELCWGARLSGLGRCLRRGWPSMPD